MGTYIDSSLITEEHLDFVKIKDEHLNNLTLDDLRNDIYEYIVMFIEESDLDYSTGDSWEDNNVILGIKYSDMKSNETLDDFKDKVKKQIKYTMNIDVEVGHIEECWRNG